jgi:hypothetical protein
MVDRRDSKTYFIINIFPRRTPAFLASKHVWTRYTAASRQAEASGDNVVVVVMVLEVSVDINTGLVTSVTAK